ncbi:folylpolyglutamate synthase-like [Lycium ferocissimum]|uniref:folylpolyglutamate synthase-like n=1 Tax=Lycium ferocissimum TaxID=112874 RepID=UPI002814DE3E|nr:folylpolyglutamate synthase-like [Lycium ferocissimum]
MNKRVHQSFDDLIPSVRWQDLFSRAIISVRKLIKFLKMPYSLLKLGFGRVAVHMEIRPICVALVYAFIYTAVGVINQYIKLVVEALLVTLRYDIGYMVEDSLDWMELISLQSNILGANSHLCRLLLLMADGGSCCYIITTQIRCEDELQRGKAVPQDEIFKITHTRKEKNADGGMSKIGKCWKKYSRFSTTGGRKSAQIFHNFDHMRLLFLASKQAYEEDSLPEQFLRGLSAARLSGRAQIFVDPLINSSGRSERLSGDLTFYLDGAHSPESMDACARWYSAAAVERKDLSLSSVSPKVETMERVWTNSYIKHCHNEESDEILKRILLFNCMDARDPQILLPKLVDTCASSGVYFSKAIFVPSISAYTKVTSATSTIPSNIPGKDLSWQFNLQRIWERIINGKDVPDLNLKIKASAGLPPREFLYEEASRCGPGDGYFACSSAVIPSLPLAINWLRDCVRENPSLRLQVLVTGSLHLVGDVLKLLRR